MNPKLKKFIKAPKCNYEILNPEWIKINYPKTYDLIYQEAINKYIDSKVMRETYRDIDD
jgi:hypothetical protein